MALDELFSLSRVISPDTTLSQQRLAIYSTMSYGLTTDAPNWVSFVDITPDEFVSELRNNLQ